MGAVGTHLGQSNKTRLQRVMGLGTVGLCGHGRRLQDLKLDIISHLYLKITVVPVWRRTVGSQEGKQMSREDEKW